MALLKLDTKVCAYPPEVFPVADAVNLLAGDNNMLEYTSLKVRNTIVSLCGISTQKADARIHIIADNIEAMKSDLRPSRGLDYNDEVRISANDSMLLKVYSATAINSFASRFLIRMDRATPLVRKYYNLQLDSRDLELLSKYNISDVVSSEYNPYSDNVYRISTVYRSLTSGGTVFRERVKPGEKISILDISVDDRPDPDTANIIISRDGLIDLELDACCMPTISLSSGSRYVSTCKITAVDDVIVSVDTSEPIGIRVVYLVGKLSLEEKVKWGLKLTQEEQKIAASKNLMELAEVGLI